MTRRVFAGLWTASLLRAAPGLTPAQIREIETAISAEMTSKRIPGLSIAVATRDGSVWSNGYGMSDLENFVPAKANTVFRTASIAKPMTAVVAMQLVESGALDLDAPVDRYLPDFPRKPWPVTTRQLLGHLGGVRSYRDGPESYITKHYFNLPDSVKVFWEDPLVHEPGTKYLYSTFGYVLAGYVLEKVARKPFTDLLQAGVLIPSGMKSTFVDDVYTLIPNRSRGYQRTVEGSVLNAALADTSHKIPGGGLVSTSPDLVSFAHAVQSGRLLKKESVEEMFRPGTTRDGLSTGYGLGWGLADFNGRRQVSHGGGQAGVSTLLHTIPSERVTVALMCNLEGVRLQEVTDRIMSVALQ